MTEISLYETTVLSLGALFLGIIMLIKGGNWAVDAAVYVAYKFGISPMIVGFTIVALGTSLPELVVSILANLQGSPGIAIGNVLGSNIANILMVLGCSALFMPLVARRSNALIRDMGFMIIVTALVSFLLFYGGITRVVGIAMFLGLVAYVFVQYKMGDESFEEVDASELTFKNSVSALGTLFVGLISIAVGAEFLVNGAKVSAHLVGVPESIIALSIIAFGTSLPELSTSIIAAKRGETGIVIGNIIGSNVFNILMILGLSAAVKPIIEGSYTPQLASFDSIVTLVVAIVFAMILLIREKISRFIGILFIAAYLGYNAYIYMVNISV